MLALSGKRIAILEARMTSELANLIQRHGGKVLQAPALKEASVDASAEVAELIERLQTKAITHIVVQTGVGVAGLLTEAEKLNRKEELIALLQASTVIARGPKPLSVLSRNGIKAQISTNEPHTTTDLISACNTLDLTGQTIAVLHYGERNAELTNALQTQGGNVFELCLYEWQMPENTEPLRTMIAATINGELDVVAFTSQIQARHLFQIADDLGQAEELRAALNQKTVVASVGPTCSAALQTFGVPPRIEPTHPKMGQMVLAITDYFNSQ